MRLIERARAGGGGGSDVREEVRELVEREAAALSEVERSALCERVLRLAGGLGPLEPLLADATVDEVMERVGANEKDLVVVAVVDV